MISSLDIQGYRGFDRFELSGLGRLNLLVGTNNGGKTSVLESIFLLMSAGDPAALSHVLSRRGESLLAEVPTSPPVLLVEPEARHLFSGHEIRAGSRLALSAANQAQRRSVEFVVVETSQKDQADLFAADDDGVPLPRFALKVTGHPQPPIPLIPLSRHGGLREAFEAPRRSARRPGELPVFIASESLTTNELVSLWNAVSLTPAESVVLRALQFIDPEIERIAVQVATAHSFYSTGSRGGFIVKRRGTERPIPIGSLGDGMWRMLVLAIAISQCRRGVLLVDEIDTGLHYSVMSQMWQLISNAAKEFDVQVFATTHSYDCVYSLAHICAEADERNPITVQRIEAGKSKAVPYAQNEIRIAADREIEVR
jgi:hypothetical protein